MWKNNQYRLKEGSVCESVLSVCVFVVLLVQMQAMASVFSSRISGCSWRACPCGCCAESWFKSGRVRRWPRTTTTLSTRRRWVRVTTCLMEYSNTHTCVTQIYTHAHKHREHVLSRREVQLSPLLMGVMCCSLTHFKHNDERSWNFPALMETHYIFI